MKKSIIPISVILGFIMFIGIAITTNLFKGNDLPVQISGALLEAVVTALITYFLLTGQTTQEEVKERQVKIFEKKQEVYHNFLEELKRIIQDGEITISKKTKNSDSNQDIDELKDLIFQLCFLQMHTEKERSEEIFEGVSRIIQLLNESNSDIENRQSKLPNFYASLSEELFKIVAILKSDLYQKTSIPIEKEKIRAILTECDLYIDDQINNKYDLQKYFWDKLQEKFIQRGYKFSKIDFTKDIQEFHARARNRHRWYGFEFEIYKSKQFNQPVMFKVEIENDYYYGFPRGKSSIPSDLMIECIKSASKSFAQTEAWFGWKYSNGLKLDFWRFDSQGFENLRDPKTREQFICSIADEMESTIKGFVAAAESMKL